MIYFLTHDACRTGIILCNMKYFRDLIIAISQLPSIPPPPHPTEQQQQRQKALTEQLSPKKNAPQNLLRSV